MDLDKLINEDTSKEGKEFTYLDANFCISPYGKRYENKLARLTDLFRKRNRGKIGTPEQQRELSCEAAFGTILHGWSNVKKSGAEIPFNAENVKAILLKYQSIRNFVFETSNDTTSFVEAVEVEDADADENQAQPNTGAGDTDNGAGAELKSEPSLAS